jgi:hypothetical protein
MVRLIKTVLVFLRFMWRGLAALKPRSGQDFRRLASWCMALASDSRTYVNLDERCSVECYQKLASFVSGCDSVHPHFMSDLDATKPFRSQSSTSSDVVIRLDCDNGDVDAAASIIHIFSEAQVNLSAHILVDGVEYDPSAFLDTVRPDVPFCKFGLHSACWTHPAPRDNLIAEIAKFQALFGYKPESISLHGNIARNHVSLLRRSEFIREWNATHRDIAIHYGFQWTCQDSRVSSYFRKPCVTAERLRPLLLPRTVGNVVLHNNYLNLSKA